MDILKIASLLDDSGDYELSDKLFKIAQQGFLSRVKNFFTPKSLVNNITKTTFTPIQPIISFGEKIIDDQKKRTNPIRQIGEQGSKIVSSPFVQSIIKDAPAELTKLIYSYGVEKLETNEGLQGFINLLTTNYGTKFDDFITRVKMSDYKRPLPPKIGNTGAGKVYTMGNNQAFESFLQTTTKLSPSAKLALRGLLQSTGKNLQNISKSLEGFAGSPQAQLIEPAIEIAFNEFGKYLENPQAYKSSMSVNQKAVEQSINPYKAWQELVLSYKAKYKTPQAILAAFKKVNPSISIQVPNFAQGQLFDQPFSMGTQTSRTFNQLDPTVQQNIIYMINNNGALPPGNDNTPNMSLNELNKLKNQQ